jgi:peptide deformylase
MARGIGFGPYPWSMAGYDIRVFGDPVLRQIASDVTNVDGALVKLTQDMIQTMYDAPGLGLAAPQVGVQKRLFVYDLHDGEGAKVLVNPIIKESRGEWSYDEGCLSIPDMSYEIVRPKEIHLTGYDLDGNEISVEADELLARLYQHELDHLDGKLLLDYLDETQKAEAMRTLRNRMLTAEPKAQPQAQPQASKNKFGISLPGLK